jgi:hypothetical protein
LDQQKICRLNEGRNDKKDYKDMKVENEKNATKTSKKGNEGRNDKKDYKDMKLRVM